MKKTFALLVLAGLCACGSQEALPSSTVAAPVSAPATPAAPEPLQGDFPAWLNGVKREALSLGIVQPVIEDAFAGIDAPSEDILKRDRTQPEHVKTFPEYMKGVVSERRVEKARDEWRTHAESLRRIERIYGVPAPIVLSLWCLESNFGEHQGSYSIIESLATLAYDGRRASFFRGELIDALRILQQEHMQAASLTGSWAGAMGQTQFMPSSYLKFAVDFDGDGRKDIWNSDADALASIANYLHQSGWNAAQGWAVAVRIPEVTANVPQSKEYYPLAYWKKRGVRRADGASLPRAKVPARLILPDGDPRYAMLAYPNYDVLMNWNHSIYFVTSVGELADAIRSR